MATKKARVPMPTPKSRRLEVPARPGVSDDRALTDMLAKGEVTGAIAIVGFAVADHGELSLTDMVASLRASGEAVNRGDLRAAEAMLNAQAVALNTVFGEMARRAALNMGTYMGATDTYLRLALKAQAQCRATVETLATIKNPPMVFARQANINNGGQQQVNNGVPGDPERSARTHVHDQKTEQTKLLKASHGQRLDTRTKSKARRSNQALEALGEVHRA